jgi:uncharacterized protein YjdB
MQIRRLISIAVCAPLVVFALACGNSSTSPSTVSSIAITGAAPAIGASSQFTAVATMSDGSAQDVTNTATWTSSNTADATVSSTGVVSGVAPGTVAIQATFQNVTGSDQITLTQ